MFWYKKWEGKIKKIKNNIQIHVLNVYDIDIATTEMSIKE
jgi:hypothetical protein